MRFLKIWWHKRQARKTSIQIANLTCSFGCGIDMINVATGGEYNRLVNIFNRHVLWLKENDLKYPK